MKRTRKLPACGNPECACSSGYAEELTFGWNETEDPDGMFNGYWEHPCLVCAKAFTANNPDMAKEYGVWPEV